MENLFRLMLVRPAVVQDPENPSIDLTQKSAFQDSLRAIPQDGVDARGQAKTVAAAYVGTATFLGSPEEHPRATQLSELSTALDGLEAQPGAVKHKDVTDAIAAAFGATAATVVKSNLFTDGLTRLRDSLLAIKLLQEEHSRPIEELTRQLRTSEVITKAVDDAAFPAGAASLRRWRRRSLQLPLTVAGNTVLSTRQKEDDLRKQRQTQVDERRREVADRVEHYKRLAEVVRELSAIPGSALREQVQEASARALPPDRLRLIPATERVSGYASEIRGLHVEQMRRGIESRGLDLRSAELGDRLASAGASTAFATADLGKTLVSTVATTLPGRTAFAPITLSEIGFVLHPNAVASVSGPTLEILKERQIDLTSTAVDKATGVIQTEMANTASEIEALVGQPTKQSFMRVGDATISIQTPLALDWGAFAWGGVIPWPTIPLDGRIPHTKGSVAPAGIADLLVVKQQLIGYEGMDIAHIENVLKGERKLREHTHRETSETITFTETESIKSEEHELETTDRFEMTRETATTIKEDIAVKAGLKVSGSYGPTVEFAVSAEGSYNRSKEEATKTATKFSQDVTERSSKKISERILQRVQTTLTTETIEKNSHELNNVPGTGHISGVYQWVNKVYQAQMFNYGLRTMFDFMVPEPAAFLIQAMVNAHDSAMTLQKPPDFNLTPSQLTETNYSAWVKVTGATDVAPPPEIYRTKAADFKAGGGEHDANYNHSGQIAIDDGYKAIFGSVGVVRNIWESDNSVDMVLGRRTQRMSDGNWMWTTSLDEERDTIPFGIDTFHCSQVAVVIEVKCVRTDRAMEKWRLDTHAKLQTAHNQQVADYEEKLKALQLQAGIAIHGHNPASNLATIETELKKNCVSILTDQHFDLFDAISTSWTNNLPEIDIYEAAGEGPYVRFFEQAFEWEHMSYITYPYFWGRKSQWDERIGYEDPDPVFADFLKAGYCRVSVPARPGFEGAIDHFLTFGETWNGGPLPSISSPLYLPIADEIAERLDRPGDEIPQGDPWKVRIPTNLVHLRPDDKLPKWQQNAQGEWVEV
jgi:hypothetical protein